MLLKKLAQQNEDETVARFHVLNKPTYFPIIGKPPLVYYFFLKYVLLSERFRDRETAYSHHTTQIYTTNILAIQNGECTAKFLLFAWSSWLKNARIKKITGTDVSFQFERDIGNSHFVLWNYYDKRYFKAKNAGIEYMSFVIPRRK